MTHFFLRLWIIFFIFFLFPVHFFEPPFWTPNPRQMKRDPCTKGKGGGWFCTRKRSASAPPGGAKRWLSFGCGIGLLSGAGPVPIPPALQSGLFSIDSRSWSKMGAKKNGLGTKKENQTDPRPTPLTDPRPTPQPRRCGQSGCLTSLSLPPHSPCFPCGELIYMRMMAHS